MNIKLAASLLMLAGSASAQVRAVPATGPAPLWGPVVLTAPAVSGGWESFGPLKVETGSNAGSLAIPSPAPELARPKAVYAAAASFNGFQPEDLRVRELVNGFDAAMKEPEEDGAPGKLFDGATLKESAASKYPVPPVSEELPTIRSFEAVRPLFTPSTLPMRLFPAQAVDPKAGRLGLSTPELAARRSLSKWRNNVAWGDLGLLAAIFGTPAAVGFGFGAGVGTLAGLNWLIPGLLGGGVFLAGAIALLKQLGKLRMR